MAFKSTELSKNNNKLLTGPRSRRCMRSQSVPLAIIELSNKVHWRQKFTAKRAHIASDLPGCQPHCLRGEIEPPDGAEPQRGGVLP
eukprot:scaffold638537_cov32-Prasinocladus_malaysianus.AAC.1